MKTRVNFSMLILLSSILFIASFNEITAQTRSKVNVRDHRIHMPKRSSNKRYRTKRSKTQRTNNSTIVAPNNYQVNKYGQLIPFFPNKDKDKGKKGTTNCFTIPCPSGAPEGAVCWDCKEQKVK